MTTTRQPEVHSPTQVDADWLLELRKPIMDWAREVAGMCCACLDKALLVLCFVMPPWHMGPWPLRLACIMAFARLNTFIYAKTIDHKMLRAATVIYELVMDPVADDGDLSSFSDTSPAFESFVKGPFHNRSELTRVLEIRSLYLGHLLITLAGVLKGKLSLPPVMEKVTSSRKA